MADITQWEYKKVSSRESDVNELNELGNAGWEAVGITSQGNTTFTETLLKRPKQPQRPAPSDGYGYGR